MTTLLASGQDDGDVRLSKDGLIAGDGESSASD